MSTHSSISMEDMLSWKRPDSVPFPSFQKKFVGRKPLKDSADGKPPSYVVQEIPSERFEEVVRLMADVFLREEPLTSAFNLRDDPEAMAEIRGLWQLVLSQGVSVCAMVENPDGSAGPIAGVNLLMVSQPSFKPEPQNDKLRRIVKTVVEVESSVQPDVFELFGVSEELSAIGLVVDATHRGQDLGEQLLRARWELGRTLGLKVSTTIFTGPTSQLLARRVGFKPLMERRYKDCTEPELQRVTSSPSMIFMAAKLE